MQLIIFTYIQNDTDSPECVQGFWENGSPLIIYFVYLPMDVVDWSSISLDGIF